MDHMVQKHLGNSVRCPGAGGADWGVDWGAVWGADWGGGEERHLAGVVLS